MEVEPVNEYGVITIDFAMEMIVPQNITNSLYDDIFLLKVWSVIDDSYVEGHFGNNLRKLSIEAQDDLFEEA